jgi:hypothetical protein
MGQKSTRQKPKNKNTGKEGSVKKSNNQGVSSLTYL